MMNRLGNIALIAVLTFAAVAIAAVALAADMPKLTEADCIQTLKGDADWQQKHYACRALRQVGTQASIPVLAPLLQDTKLSHLARYALEPMPFPEAGKALRDALNQTQGELKIGVIGSLGARRDADAVEPLVSAMQGEDNGVACAAIAALGRIATPAAIEALQKLDAKPERSTVVAESLLVAGDLLVKQGDSARAVKLYTSLMDVSLDFARLGAFRGLVHAQPDKAPELLLAALGADDALMRDFAAQLITETATAESIPAYTQALAKLPDAGQIALLRGLAARKDASSRPAVIEALNGGGKEIKLAAVKALRYVGNADDVPALAALVSNPDFGPGAVATLTDMEGDDIDAAVAAAVPSAALSDRAQLLDLLALRQAPQAVPLALDALKGKDVPVRQAALRVLAIAGAAEQGPAAIDAVLNPSDPSERPLAEKALSAICARKSETLVPALAAAIEKAAPEPRVSLLRGAAQISNGDALQLVLAAMNGSDAQVSEEAVRLLSNWSTAEALPHLRALAESEDVTRQVLGLRGYVRLAQAEPDLGKKTALLDGIRPLIKRADEKKLLIAAWGSIQSDLAFKALLPYLDDPDTKNEAALAILSVAEFLADKPETKPVAIDKLNLILQKSQDENIKAKTNDMLQRHK